MSFLKAHITLVCSLFLVAAQAQKIESALKALNEAFPQEKIYIQYDNDHYTAGQTAWFKAYLYSSGKPSGVSNNFYVQLTNNKGEIVGHKEFPIIGATVAGSIDIPDSLGQGNYYMSAFTPGIINYDAALSYKKRLIIYARNATHIKTINPATDLSIQFYPESGVLLDDMVMTIGFKAVNEKGWPAAVNGYIRLEDGTNIAPFKTYHDGIGKIQLKTRVGKKYIAEVETPSGLKKFPLPEVKQYGINLKLSDEKGGKKFVITRRVEKAGDFGNLTVIADMNNQVVYKMDIAMEDYPDAEGHLTTDSLPSGILHFTLFNRDGLPLCERLTFVNNGEYRGKGDLAAVKMDLAKRGANEMEIKFPDNTLRSCSVAVTDNAFAGIDDVENIWSGLLLTSDLKGYIYNPSWYFKEGNDSSSQALDNLLLTHGWSRFKWEKILAGDLPKKVFSDPYMTGLSGQVFDQKANKPVSNGNLNVLLEYGAGKPQVYIVTVDASGNFKIDSLAYFGETKVYFDYLDKSGKAKPITVQLSTKNDLALLLEKAKQSSPVTDELIGSQSPAMQAYAEKINEGQQSFDTAKLLETAVVKAVKLQEKRPMQILDEKYTKGVFTQQPRTIIDNETIPVLDGSMDALRFVANRISQVDLVDDGFYSKHKTTFSMPRRTIGSAGPGNVKLRSSNIVSGYPVTVFLNEMQIEAVQLKALAAKDIAYVKYFENFAGGGIGTIGGAIAVYTTTPTYETKSGPDYPEYSIKVAGYSISKEFFNPNYGDPTFKQPETDTRTTLYWDPNVMTGPESNTIKMNFYNNDFSKALRVIVEGFDSDGKLIHIERIISK